MTGYVVLLGGITLFAVAIAVWDLIARRQDRRRESKHRAM
jgi:hypothetical protein